MCLNRPNLKMSKVVLGGGISGLSAAYYLQKRCPQEQISLIEASSRLGGWIKSTPQKDGHIFEQGPRTIRPRGVKGINTLELIEELGLGPDVTAIPSHHPAALNRMIYVNGQLHSLPSSLWGILKTQSPFSKPLISSLFNDITAPKKRIPVNDESIYSFVERRFGKEIADYAISPMICGICAGNAELISVKFLMENLFVNEQKYGSISKGILYNVFKRNKGTKVSNNFLSERAKKEKWSVYAFKNGLETLPKRLEQINRENGVKILLNAPSTAVEIDNKVTIHTSKGDKIVTDHLISCIPAKTIGNLLTGHAELTNLLKSIPFVNVCVINLHYKSKLLMEEGFGFLVPPKENIPILGVIYDSCCFPRGDSTVLTVMMGGHWFQKYFGDTATENDFLDIALSQIKTILGINEKPASFKINILKDCIPQYLVGHKEKLNQINNYIKSNNLPLSLCGASYEGVGVNDVIMSARSAVDAIQI